MSVEAAAKSLHPAPLLAVAGRHLFPHWFLWLGPAALLLTNLAWIALSPRLSLSAQSLWPMSVVVLGCPAALAYRHLRGHELEPGLDRLFKGLMVALFAGLFTQQVGLLNHLLLTLALPLADGRLHAADIALGFDWNRYIQTVAAQPLNRAVLLFAYSWLLPPAIFLIIAVALWRGREDRVEELAFLVLVSGFVCILVAGVLPAEAAWNTIATAETRQLLGGQPGLNWVDQFRNLRGSGPVPLDLRRLEGLATFPSFHACLAIIVIWCSRGHWLGFATGAVAGVLILLATPVYGAHYGVDLLGGAAVMAGAILAWRVVSPALRAGAGRP